MAIDGVTPMSPFEIALMEILADNEPPDLSEETALLLYELDSLRDQAEVLNDFDEDHGAGYRAARPAPESSCWATTSIIRRC